MVFANPLAWFGLATLAIPLAVHWLRRHHARRQAFPTLRFLPAGRIASSRRHRPTDWVLLFVRLTVVAVAVMALAQPVWRPQRIHGAPGLSRAIVIDHAVAESTPSGVSSALDAMPHADHTVTIDARDLRAGLADAEGWVVRQARPREIAVLSRFPQGTVSADDVDDVPADVGFHAVPVRGSIATASQGPNVRWADGAAAPMSLTPRLTLDDAHTTVEWTPGSSVEDGAIDWHASPTDALDLSAALDAAGRAGGVEDASGRRILVMCPGAMDLDAVSSRAVALTRPWMADVVSALARDRTLTASAADSTAREASRVSASTVVISDAHGTPAVVAAADGRDDRLVLFANVPPASALTVALAYALPRASRALDWSAYETSLIPQSTLTGWQRSPATGAPSADVISGTPSGRWLWIVVLALLGLESWLRTINARADRSTVDVRRVA